MTQLVQQILEQWKLVVAAPVPVLTLMAASAAAGFWVAKLIYSAVVEAARERATGAREEAERLNAQKDFLLEDMGRHGRDIAALKEQLEGLPKIRVSDRPPGPNDKARDGDLWIQV